MYTFIHYRLLNSSFLLLFFWCPVGSCPHLQMDTCLDTCIKHLDKLMMLCLITLTQIILYFYFYLNKLRYQYIIASRFHLTWLWVFQPDTRILSVFQPLSYHCTRIDQFSPLNLYPRTRMTVDHNRSNLIPTAFGASTVLDWQYPGSGGIRWTLSSS